MPSSRAFESNALNELEYADQSTTMDITEHHIAKAQIYALLQIADILDYHLSNITGTLKGEK